MKIRVYYEDTDTGGVVYHSNYLNYCERDRSERFFAKGLSPARKESHFVASSLEARYIQPAKLGDTLQVTSALVKMKAASFSIHHEIYRDDVKLFEMDIKLAYIGYDGRPKAIEPEIRVLIEELFD